MLTAGKNLTANFSLAKLKMIFDYTFPFYVWRKCGKLWYMDIVKNVLSPLNVNCHRLFKS
jgi:hypothetical protein